MFYSFFSVVQAKKGEGESDSAPVTSAVKVSGCVLHFTGVGADKSREDIREELLPFGTVAFIDFERGQTEVSIYTLSICESFYKFVGVGLGVCEVP